MYMQLIHTEFPFAAPMLPKVLVGPTKGKFRFGVAVVLPGFEGTYPTMRLPAFPFRVLEFRSV
jgi:hypothetical protein